MKVTLGNKENNKVNFNIEVPETDFKKELQKAYLKNRGQFNIPGFRKGKVPRKIIEMNYGKDVFYEDAINKILPEVYENAIKELNLEPIDAPEVDIEEIEEGKEVIVNFTVEVKPEVVLGEYKNIEIEKVEYDVTDELVENEVKSVQDMNGRIIDAGDRAVENGDLLTIDYAGYVDGAQFDGGTAEGHELEIGSDQFIPGFEEQLVGKNKGEEIDVVVTFPEDYHEESLKAKEATFKVTIHDIKEKELPVLDDEFAKDVSDFDTLEEYKTSIREKLEEEFKKREEVEHENNVIEKVVDSCEVEIPEAMINNQLENEVGEFGHRLTSQGLELEQYLSLTGSSMEELKDQLRPVAVKRVKGDLVLEAIAKEEKIEINDEDIDKELERMAEIYQQDNKEKFVEDMKKGDLSFLNTAITNQKTIDFLVGNAKLV